MFARRRIFSLCFAAAVPGHLRVREVSVSKRHRSFLLASLLPAFLLVSVFAVVQAQEGRSPAARQARWSDPATWPDRRVPRAGDKVTIAPGKEVRSEERRVGKEGRCRGWTTREKRRQ